MKLIFCVILNIILALCDNNVEQAFKANEIEPDILDSSPQIFISLKYEKTGKEVNLGNELQPKDVREIPNVDYNADKDSYYTLIMTDPDPPSRKNPTVREWNHWLVVNIPGNEVNKGEIISEYVGSGPPKDTGLHRYVFILYKQSGKLDFSESTKHSNTDGNRGKFSTKKFAKKYNLGHPIAGNFFQSQYDDSVPALYKQFN